MPGRSLKSATLERLQRRRATLVAAYAGTLVAALAGCDLHLGTGGTGELVIPRHQLREVTPIDLADLSRPTPPPTRPADPDTRPATTRATTGPAAIQATTRPAAPPEVFLSLADVRRLALENNLDLKVELLSPTILKQSISEEEARFEAAFTSNLQYARTDSPVPSQLEGSQGESWQWNSGLAIPLRTGGTIGLNAPLARNETDNAFTFLNPAYFTGPSVSITHPLLRGFGVDYNAQRIRVAFYAYESAEVQAKLRVIAVLADAERAYWRVYAAREALKLRREQKKLSVAQQERAVRQFQQQAVVELDVARAESAVADAEEQIILAARDLRDRERELKRILNVPSLDVGTDTQIVPADRPVAAAYNLDAGRVVDAAMAQRMELMEEEIRIAEDSANIRVARNDLLPLVTLEYTYGVNGLGPSLNDALSQVRHADFQSHTAGLRVEVPIGNEAARSRYRRSTYEKVQRLATREQRRLQIRQEVFGAVDTLTANWQRILAARNRVRLAGRVYDGEVRQYKQGRRTSTEVADAETKLADARQSEIVAVAEYQISQVDVAVAAGMLLGQSKVAWEPTVSPEADRRR